MSASDARARLASRNDPNNLEVVAGLDLSRGEFGRGHRLTIMLDDDAPWVELLGLQKGVDATRQIGGHLFAICYDISFAHPKSTYRSLNPESKGSEWQNPIANLQIGTWQAVGLLLKMAKSAMNEIEVTKRDSETFEVQVKGTAATTQHTVTLKPEYYQKLAAGKVPPEILVKKSFEFLLERESNTSILGQFELSVINQYFPDYERLIPLRLS